MRSGAVRLAVSSLLLALVALLLVPGPAPPRPVSWSELIAPLAVGQPVAGGFVLGPPRRGAEQDVVYVARRPPGPDGPAARVEVHILDRGRWPGVAETASFSIGWEMPRPGARGAATPEDSEAVRDAIAAAVAANDPGSASVGSIPLESEPAAPPIVSVLERLAGWRGVAVGVAGSGALLLLASLPGGGVAVGAVLLALGLALRAPSLGVPFERDQDVQRLFTGNLPLAEIATGAGLQDRHPPLYFFVLHAAQRFGQSEAVGRAPAVAAGALAGPAVLLAAARLAGGIGAGAVVAALAVTVSPELVARSREVSEIPLYALLVLAAAAALVAALRAPRPACLAALALATALTFYTYYLAPFLAAAHAAVLWRRRAGRRVVAAFAAGLAAALPAVALAAATLFRDWGARDAARAFPALAWGEHGPVELSAHMLRLAVEAFGAPLLALALAAMLAGALRRDLAAVVPALGTLATVAGIALLAPIARVQAYYVTTVLPLALLPLALLPDPARGGRRRAWIAALVLAVGGATVPLLAGARPLYVPSADAFMPRFARVVAARPEPVVVTVAHYDKTLLAYYLARARGRSIAWDRVDDPRPPRIEALVLVHSLGPGSEAAAVRRLDELVAAGPTLVIERDAVLLPKLVERLAACEPIDHAPTARLLRCGPRPAGAAH